MSLIALLVLAIAVIPAFAIAALAWVALAADANELQSFKDFDGVRTERLESL